VPKKKVVVVGAGPAGMMAAIRSAQLGQEVSLIEKNLLPGRKLLLSGKGRCNLTNACDLNSFISRFNSGGQFLRDAFKIFFNRDLMQFFEERGLRLKVERQLRVFPESDRSASILEILERELRSLKVKTLFDCHLRDILVRNGRVEALVTYRGQNIPADRIILATGGASYKFTGSTGEGFTIAEKLGHRIIGLQPGLVPFLTKERYADLEGLTLRNIRLKFSSGKRKIVSEIGELLFTGSGVSGPLVLSLSSRLSDLLENNALLRMEIDLKPALTPEQIDARLLREFSRGSKKSIRNLMKLLLPASLAETLLKIAGIDLQKRANQVTQAERVKLAAMLKAFPLEIKGPASLEEAMVTRGGVCLKQISPRTMESRMVKGLYFAGEMIDVDADTGGFNLQAAFSTGYLAGQSASS
jgi:hypothetical protein